MGLTRKFRAESHYLIHLLESRLTGYTTRNTTITTTTTTAVIAMATATTIIAAVAVLLHHSLLLPLTIFQINKVCFQYHNARLIISS